MARGSSIAVWFIGGGVGIEGWGGNAIGVLEKQLGQRKRTRPASEEAGRETIVLLQVREQAV